MLEAELQRVQRPELQLELQLTQWMSKEEVLQLKQSAAPEADATEVEAEEAGAGAQLDSSARELAVAAQEPRLSVLEEEVEEAEEESADPEAALAPTPSCLNQQLWVTAAAATEQFALQMARAAATECAHASKKPTRLLDP